MTNTKKRQPRIIIKLMYLFVFVFFSKSVHEDSFTMSSSNEAEQDTAPSTQLSTIEVNLNV